MERSALDCREQQRGSGGSGGGGSSGGFCGGGGGCAQQEQLAAPSCSAGSGPQDERNKGEGAAVLPEHVSAAREAAVVGLVALASLNQTRQNAAGQACGRAVPAAGQKRTSSGGLVHPLPALNAAAQELLQLVSTRAEARAEAEAFRREHPNQRVLLMPAAEGPLASRGGHPAASCARAGTSAPLHQQQAAAAAAAAPAAAPDSAVPVVAAPSSTAASIEKQPTAGGGRPPAPAPASMPRLASPAAAAAGAAAAAAAAMPAPHSSDEQPAVRPDAANASWATGHQPWQAGVPGAPGATSLHDLLSGGSWDTCLGHLPQLGHHGLNIDLTVPV